MSSTSLPPLPALIPIASLRKSPPCNNNSGAENGAHQNCAPCANQSKVMGEQRPRRPGRQPSVDLIDNVRSRGTSATPQARKIRPERHRKSDRRRDRRRRGKTQLEIENKQRDDLKKSPERPVNPRVNPIFVWVRQEDTRIVEVKCEDYDKRNRILLTKTPQGWRATPRTETLVPSLKEEADKKHHHHHHHRSKKSKKHKTKQKSAAVQVDDLSDENIDEVQQSETQDSFPSWESPVNVESLLPSHTIHVPKKNSTDPEQSSPNSPCVNSGVKDSAQSECSVEKICDVSPLDNLLAVAELEFNQQIQSGEWEKNPHTNDFEADADDSENHDEMNEEQKIFLEDMEHLKNLIESCTQDEDSKLLVGEDYINTQPKEECDYTEEEENNLAMDDILNRLEQSLRSPETPEPMLIIDENKAGPQKSVEDKKGLKSHLEDFSETIPGDCETKIDENDDHCETISISDSIDIPHESQIEEKDVGGPHEDQLEDKEVGTPMKADEGPTDLSLKHKVDLTIEIPSKNDEPEGPTDLSIPRNNKISHILTLAPRPASQSSDALQSPQPSGIPAVPPSPDIVSPNIVNSTSTVSTNRHKSTFLETLLASSSPKMALNSEVTIERQKEPLDLGKCRKSASPTITCSEEVKSNFIEGEPPAKKLKHSEPITLENLLNNVIEAKKMQENSQNSQDTPKLLQLLNTEIEMSPIDQLQQVLSNKSISVPDPMLVPKDKLSRIIAHPGKEIPELLKNRPELRLPEALAYPHLLQDPDILVITIQQLQTIVKKQNPFSGGKTHMKPPSPVIRNDVSEKPTEKHISKKVDKEKAKNTHRIEETVKSGHSVRDFDRKTESNEFDLTSGAAFNPMLWLPYMNQMEAMQFGGNSDFMKMLANANMATTFPTQMSDLSHLLSNNRFPSVPNNFPTPAMNYNNPLEMQMWQEAMMQTNFMGPKNSNNSETRNNFRDFMEKMNFSGMNKSFTQNPKFQTQQNKQSQFFPTPSVMPGLPNHYMNLPFQTNMKSTMPMPNQFNSMFAQKSLAEHNNLTKHHSKSDSKLGMGNSFHHDKSGSYGRNSEHHGTIRTKPAYKLMNNATALQKSTHEHHHSREKSSDGPSRLHSSQPIDLSGATTTTAGRLKVKQQQQLMDPSNRRNLLRHDEPPEVGSTTASIEEMQEAHKHLWHPLFGNEKGYNAPWNWTPTATATAE